MRLAIRNGRYTREKRNQYYEEAQYFQQKEEACQFDDIPSPQSYEDLKHNISIVESKFESKEDVFGM